MYCKLINFDKESALKNIGVLTLYKLFLEFIYVMAVSRFWAHNGFVFTPNFSKCILSYVLFFMLVCTLEREVAVNGIIVNFFFIICIMPMLSFYWLADKKTLYLVYEIIFFIILNGVAKINLEPMKIKFVNQFSRYDVIINFIFVIYIAMCLYFGYKRGGVDPRSFSFETIYDLRSESGKIIGIQAYLVEWCAKASFSFFLVYYLYIKNYIKVVLCLLCQVFLYLCFGFKAYLLSAVIILPIYFFTRYLEMRHYESNIDVVFIFLLGLIPCAFSNHNGMFGDIGYKLSDTFAMRMMYEPARVQYGWFEYFSRNNKLYFSEGLIGRLFGLNYPYDEPIGFVITRYMNGENVVSNSCTGIVADSYAQCGLFGIIVVAIFAGLLVAFLKMLSVYIPKYCISAMFFYPVFMWNDNGFLTNLLTNGWAIDIILLFIIDGDLKTRELREGQIFK